jgi:hypothetical protein
MGPGHEIYIFHSTYVLNAFHSLTSCILLDYTSYLNKRREVRIVSDSDNPKARPSPSPVIRLGPSLSFQAEPGLAHNYLWQAEIVVMSHT